MSRDEQHEAAIRRAMHTMENKRRPSFGPSDYWKGRPVLARGRFGYAVSYSDSNSGRPWNKPVQVQFNASETSYFALGEVTKATYMDYLTNPNGIGKTGLAAFLLVFIGCATGTFISSTEHDWTIVLFPIVFLCFFGFTYLNYRGTIK